MCITIYSLCVIICIDDDRMI